MTIDTVAAAVEQVEFEARATARRLIGIDEDAP